jgi:hypothetical protein
MKRVSLFAVFAAILWRLLISTNVDAQQIGTFTRIVTTEPSSASATFAGGVVAGASRNQIIDFSGRIPALTPQYFVSLDASQLTGVPSPTHNLLSATHLDTLPTTPVLGMLIYADVTPQWRTLGGNTSATKMFLNQTGNGSISAAPAWAALVDADIPDSITLSNLTQITTRSHGSLQDLLNDNHTQYALLAGRASGHSLIGGIGAAEGLNLQATSGNGVGSEFVKVLVGNNGAVTALNLTATVSQLGHTASPTTIITNKATPGSNTDGMWWSECTGVSPARVCALKINDSGTVRTIGSITF